MDEHIKLNVGCGKDVRTGWINLDMHDKNGADLVFNLEDIYKDKKMPFSDNSVDYIYCSHVLEDFINVYPILYEFIRICKIGGKIEIKTPFETNNNLDSIHHKNSFTLSKFRSLEDGNINYGHNYKLKAIELCYYTDVKMSDGRTLFGKLYRGLAPLNEYLFNSLPYCVVERTFIKSLLCFVNCKVIYIKLKDDTNVLGAVE